MSDALTSQPEQHLVGISFGHELSAAEFLLSLRRLHDQGHLQLLDAVFISSDEDGKTRVRETADPSVPQSALGGALWGSLIGLLLGGPIGWVAGAAVGSASGAVTAKFVDLGVPDAWVDWFRQTVDAGDTTLVVLVQQLDAAALATELRRFQGAQIVHTTLPPFVEERLMREASASRAGGQAGAPSAAGTWPDPQP